MKWKKPALWASEESFSRTWEAGGFTKSTIYSVDYTLVPICLIHSKLSTTKKNRPWAVEEKWKWWTKFRLPALRR